MSTTTANLYASNEPEMNEQAEAILTDLTDAELDAELEKGYTAMKEGKTRSARSAFADIRENYNL